MSYESCKNESNRDYIYVKYKASQKRPDSRNIVKREIISSLGKLKDKRATKPIIDEMKMNKDKLLLLIGISTLEQLDFEESIDAFHMILDNKQEYPKDVVTNVIDALGTIGDPLSKERLLNVLGDYQDIASVALAKIGGSGMSQILFNQWLTQNKYECKETAKALGLIDDPEIVSKMIDFIKNDQDIEKARSTLRYMKNAEDALIELVQDSNPFLRLVAIDILCHIKTKKSILLFEFFF